MRTPCCPLLPALLLAAPPTLGLDNGAALTPPMGWSTWNKLRCGFTQDTLLEVADAMVASGMVAAGYKTLNIDDCWPTKQRDSGGAIVPDPKKFPDGMRNFSAALSSRGVGLGIYTAHGAKTCQGYPGSRGHEQADAASYASWGVVYVKNDWCWHHEPNQTAHLSAFNAMRDALNATGRPMVHSIHWNYGDTPGPGCEKSVDCPLPATANMWRIGGDIKANWASVLRLVDIDEGHEGGAGPGAWNDADMMEVGNGMNEAQDKAHFTMWCMLASPLIAGNDVRTMSNVTRDILTNPHAIAVNQDPLGRQAAVISSYSPPSPFVTAAACDGSAAQTGWTLDAQGRLKGPGGLCAQPESDAPTPVTDNYPGPRVELQEDAALPHLTLADCSAGAAGQQWELTANAQLRHSQTGKCVDVHDFSGPAVELYSCKQPGQSKKGMTNQQFNLTGGAARDGDGLCLSAGAGAGAASGTAWQVWGRPLAAPEGSYAAALLNRDAGAAANITLRFADLGAGAAARYTVLDLWDGARSVGVHSGSVTATVGASSAAMYKLVPAAA